MPQNSILEESKASSHLKQFPQKPSYCANLFDIEDESDDDFKETIVVPKYP